MKRIFHVVFTSHKSVLFRNEADYIIAIDLLALTAVKYDSHILAYSFMSNHVHLIIETNCLVKFMRSYRISYSMIFNKKYKRKGPVGDRSFYKMELDSPGRLVIAISYVLRNPVHHLTTETPFDYKYCSASYYFKRSSLPDAEYNNYDKITVRKCRAMFHSNKRRASHHIIHKSGLILPESFLEIKAVEHLYQSARSLLYYMNCPSSEEWQEYQSQNCKNVIRLSDVERGTSFSMDELLKNANRRFKSRRIDDISLCQIIDNEITKRYNVSSFTEFSDSQKKSIGNYLYTKYKASKSQIIRCLGIGNSS